MEQVSPSQRRDDVNLFRKDGVLVQVPLWVARSFEGKNPEPPRRRRAVPVDPDPEINSAVPLPSPSHEDEASPHVPAGKRLVIDLTANRLCRMITIITLGIWGGWSIMPAETKVPISVTWVAYICVITDWVIFSTTVDCVFPTAMDWYFRKHPRWRLLQVKENTQSRITVTGYSILNTLVGLGIAFFKYTYRNDQPVSSSTDLIAGSLIFLSLYWLGRMEGKPEHSGAWFFHDDYGPHISSVVRIIFALWSWWWIAFRILAIVNILRNRDNPEMTFQVLTLTVGLTVEGVLLVWFFSTPSLAYLFRWEHWDKDRWYGHLPPLLAMLASWVLVVVIGLWKDLPNIFFPCSGSTSMVCSALITYA